MNLNLRHDGRGLIPATDPKAIATAAGRPVYTVRHTDGTRSVFFHDGTTLSVAVADNLPIVLATVECATVDLIAVETASALTVCAGWRRFVFTYDDVSGRWGGDVLPAEPDYPVITAETRSQLTHTLPARSLKGQYRATGSQLLRDDLRALTDDYLRACDDLEAGASAANAWMQPVVARVRVVDPDGSTLGVSSPRLLTPDPENPVSLARVSRTVTASGAYFTEVGETAVTAPAYTLRVQWTPEAAANPMMALADHIVVEVTPPLSPLDKSAPTKAQMAADGASASRLTLTMPGLDRSADLPQAYRDRIIAAACSMDSLPLTRAVIRRGAGGWESAAVVRTSPVALKTPPAALSAPGGTTLRPGAFGAAKVAVNGSLTLLGDISVAPPGRLSPLDLAAAVTDAPWSGSLATTFSDTVGGLPRRVVRTVVASSLRPAAMAPLTIVPDPRATEVRMAVGSSYRTVSLTPSPDGLWACALTPDLRPLPLVAASSAAVPAENSGPSRRLCETIAVCDPASPLSPVALAQTPPGSRIMALAPAPRSRSSWDFGRAHFYALTSGGIYAVAVNSARSRVDMSLVDPRAPDTPFSWTLTPAGLLVASGGSLLRLNGATATDIVSSTDHDRRLPSPVKAMGRDPLRAEVWAVGPTGSVVTADDSWRRVSERSIRADYLLSDGASLLVVTGRRLSDTAAGESAPQQGVAIRLTHSVILEPGQRPPRSVFLAMTSPGVSCTLTLSADGGDSDARRAVITRWQITGALNEPLRLTAVAPRRRRYTLTLEGTVSPSTLITTLSLK